MTSNNTKQAIEIKLLTLGDTSVGKSSFIIKFIDDKFSYNYIATMGLDFKQKIIELDNGELVKLRIFDTAGQERFKSISINFIKKADGILLLYDISNRSSFESVNKWVESIREVGEEKISIILIGNKCDLEKERKISKEEGEAKSTEFNLPFFETSCKEGINIKEVFVKISEEIIKKNGPNLGKEGEKITKEKAKKMNKKSGCC
jgi:small GTP-binding protein